MRKETYRYPHAVLEITEHNGQMIFKISKHYETDINRETAGSGGIGRDQGVVPDGEH